MQNIPSQFELKCQVELVYIISITQAAITYKTTMKIYLYRYRTLLHVSLFCLSRFSSFCHFLSESSAHGHYEHRCQLAGVIAAVSTGYPYNIATVCVFPSQSVCVCEWYVKVKKCSIITLVDTIWSKPNSKCVK